MTPNFMRDIKECGNESPTRKRQKIDSYKITFYSLIGIGIITILALMFSLLV